MQSSSSQYYVSKLNPSSLNAGSSMMQRARNLTSGMSWITIVLALIGTILFLWFGYSIYKSYTASLTSYNANREGNKNANSNKTANLMLFYVDWCPHCKTAKPEWEELKSEYEGKNINGYNIVFTEYNCTNESAEIDELMDKYKIEGYPTIKLIKDNQVVEYDAKPTKSTMEQFLHTVL